MAVARAPKVSSTVGTAQIVYRGCSRRYQHRYQMRSPAADCWVNLVRTEVALESL